jgi:hypothetical protein
VDSWVGWVGNLAVILELALGLLCEAPADLAIGANKRLEDSLSLEPLARRLYFLEPGGHDSDSSVLPRRLSWHRSMIAPAG